MSKVAFFYCNGSASLGPFGLINLAIAMIGNLGLTPKKLYTIAGLHGRTATWQDVSPQNDPFCSLLDPNIFEAKKIYYPAAFFPMDLSIDTGIASVMAAINAMPAGQKFMLGGFSQGAAVMSSVYNELRAGSLTSSRGADFLGGICFGNPRRQINYRGEVGGTWSGCWDIPGSTTGGHGAFSDTGPFARLTGCDPTRWIEFLHEGDVFSAVGDSTVGEGWTNYTDFISTLGKSDILAAVGSLPNFNAIKAGVEGTTAKIPMTDANGVTVDCGGGGHVAYPFLPPTGDPDNGLTSYQIAIKWLESKALASATAPILLPESPTTPSTAGWSTTLVPPAA